MNRRILAVVALSVMFGVSTATAETFPTAVTLSDLNATATFNFASSGGGLEGMTGWTVDGVSQLHQQWFWYRIGNSLPESPINSLTLDNVKVSDGNENSGVDRVVAYYNNGYGLKVSLDHVLTGGRPGAGVSDIMETITIKNTNALGSTPIDFHFFQFVDLDLMGTADDTSVQITGGNNAKQTKGGYAVSETVTNSMPSHYQADYAVNIRSLLIDAVASDLINKPSAYGGNLGWAFQWDISLAPGKDFIISKDKRLEFVPEPATLTLLVLAGLTLFAWRSFKRTRSL